jgi:glyoxylase-like metal-dependent hydrolase (beta-lactamase superfamily II)
MYLLKSGDTYVAFDTGMKVDSAVKELAKIQVEAAQVRDVVLTHSDSDHVGGLKAFPNARVHMPKDEVAMIDKTTARFFGFIFNKAFTETYDTLEDNQEVTIAGASIRCLATPGHTAGHMSYLVNGTILIAGDILNIKERKIVMDRKFINIDNMKREASIRRLAALENIGYLCTMHSGYTDDFPTAAKEWK